MFRHSILMASLAASTSMSLCSMSAASDDNYGGDGKQHWPGWYYGPEGQSQLFNNPLEVPEGWHDHPRKFNEPGAKTVIPGYEEAVAAANAGEPFVDEEAADAAERKGAPLATDNNFHREHPQVPGVKNDGSDDLDRQIREQAEKPEPYVLPPKGDISKEDIIAQLTAKRVTFNKSWSEDRLYDLLKDNLDKQPPAEGSGLTPTSEGNKL